MLRLAGDVEGVGRLRLHAEGHLERLDADFEPGIEPRACDARR